MKIKLALLLTTGFLFAENSYSQEWADSVRIARKAYQAGEYLKAVKAYQALQKKFPDSKLTKDEIAQSFYKSRSFKEASDYYKEIADKSIQQKDKNQSNYNLGNSYFQQKEYSSAIEAYKNALRANPSDSKARYNLSEALRQLKNQQKKNPSQQENPDNKSQQQQQNSKENKQNKSNPSDDQSSKRKKDKLPNRSVERILDQLEKAEAQTKRKLNGGKQKPTPSSVKNDW